MSHSFSWQHLTCYIEVVKRLQPPLVKAQPIVRFSVFLDGMCRPFMFEIIVSFSEINSVKAEKKCNVNVRCKVNKGSITSFWVSFGQEGKATRTPCVSHSYDSLFYWRFHAMYLLVWNTCNCWNTLKNVRFLILTTENYNAVQNHFCRLCY